jgi:hypothetical protein
MSTVPSIGRWPLDSTAARIQQYNPELEKERMSDSDFNTPRWSSTASSTVTQDPDLSAPRFHAHATPFAQPFRHQSRDIPHNPFLEFAMTQIPAGPPAPSGNQPLAPMSFLYDENHHVPPGYYPSYSSMYQYQPTPPAPLPRRPAFSPNRPVGARPDTNGLHGTDNMSPLSGHTTMGGVAGSHSPYPQGYETTSAPTNSPTPYVWQQQYAAMHLQPPARYVGGHEFVPAPLSSSADGSRQFLPVIRRSSQQETRQQSNRSSEYTERRTSRLANVQNRRPDGYVSSSTSARRSYDRFSHDLSQSITSSDAEEAASRIPPPFRARRLPREPRLRFLSHAQHHDPNIATSRQVSELKDKLPRCLLGELPEGVSSTCDICDKDYSSTHVAPGEDEEVAIELPCGHRFGEYCIFQWVRVAFSGPFGGLKYCSPEASLRRAKRTRTRSHVRCAESSLLSQPTLMQR